MILADKKLRIASDRVLQEIEPTEEGRTPLEWRRSFNSVNFKLKNLKLVTSSTVHDLEWSLDDKEEEHFARLLRPELVAELAISGVVDEEEMADRLYCTGEIKEDKTLVSVTRMASPIKVNVKIGEPTEESKERPAGLYWGNAFSLDNDPRIEGFLFEMRVPREHLLGLVAALKTDTYAVVELQVLLLSFTYEVDDFLREPWHSQDIILHSRSAPCFVRWIGVTSKIGNHLVPVAADEGQDGSEKREESEVTSEQRAHSELMQILLSYSKPLKGVVTALWMLIAVIVLYAIFK